MAQFKTVCQRDFLFFILHYVTRSINDDLDG